MKGRRWEERSSASSRPFGWTFAVPWGSDFPQLVGAVPLLSLGPMPKGTPEGVHGRHLLKVSEPLPSEIVNVNFDE